VVFRLFGIRLSPKISGSRCSRPPADFGSLAYELSFWLRDYIFFRLQRWLARLIFHPQAFKITLPPFITMIVSGLWHNATLSMVGWGLLHASIRPAIT
jgi:hypothetical protein